MGNQASVVLHEQTVCLSSVSSFLFSFSVWICTAPSMVAYRNTLVITQRESWHAGGIMKREEAILAGSFFISHRFLMSGQFRVEGWGSRKWKEKKKKKATATTPTTKTSDKPRKQQHVLRLLAPQLKGLFSYPALSHVPDSRRLRGWNTGSLFWRSSLLGFGNIFRPF